MTTAIFPRSLRTFFRSSLLATLLIQLLFTVPLRAQTAAPSDAQLDRDVQLLLTNDDDFAEAKRQVYAKEISNVDYTKQINALTATRNAIVKQYDRPGYQKLLGLYNAAKRDKAVAAAAVKAAAVADARAKAAADKESARLEAVRVAEEKAAQAKAAAEALTQQVTADAQTLVKVQLREMELELRSFLGTLTPVEQQEMSGLTTAASDLRAKYTTGGTLQAKARDFQQQTNQLYQAQLPGAHAQWVTDAFPSADQVAADYSDPLKRAAAFNFLSNLLATKAGNPLADVAEQKIRQYGAAAGKNDFDKVSKLSQDGEFQMDVLKKYLPPLVAEVRGRMAVEKAVAEAKQIQDHAIAHAKFLGGILSLLLVVMVGLSVAMSLRHQGPRSGTPADPKDPLQLPEALNLVKVFRKAYPVEFEGGYVYEKEVWTETNVSTTTSGGGSYTSGGMVYNNPVQTTTHVSTTVYHRYWMRTPDGKETWRRFSDNVFPAAKGQIISTISWGTNVLIAYNHTTNHFSVLRPGVNSAHSQKCRWIILIPMGLWTIGALVLTTLFGGKELGDLGSHYVQGGVIGLGVFLCIYAVIIKIIFSMVRGRQFNRTYAPQFRKFMEGSTMELAKRLVNNGMVSKGD